MKYSYMKTLLAIGLSLPFASSCSYGRGRKV